jgi:O-acetyl-ADP-ribose deacetylase (regulator of RNase III)
VSKPISIITLLAGGCITAGYSDEHNHVICFRVFLYSRVHIQGIGRFEWKMAYHIHGYSNARNLTSANYDTPTRYFDENLWLYVKCILKPPTLVGVELTESPFVENWRQQVQLRGSARDLDKVGDICDKLQPTFKSVIRHVPSDLGSARFRDNVEERCWHLIKDKLLVRFKSDEFYEVTGESSDVDILFREIDQLTGRQASAAGRQTTGRQASAAGGGSNKTSSAAYPSNSTDLYPSKETSATDLFQTPKCFLKVRVICGNILENDCEVIVCPTTSSMSTQFGVAKAIMEAAGPSVNAECMNLFRIKGYLAHSEVVHTSSGNIHRRSRTQYIIYVAVPGYTSSTYNQLRNAFLNCLLYANDQLHASSIAMPAIGAGTCIANIFSHSSRKLNVTYQLSAWMFKNSSTSFRMHRVGLYNSEKTDNLCCLIGSVPHRIKLIL